MRVVLVAIVMCIAALPALCQSSTSKYQVGTIMEVTPHKSSAASDSGVTRYDVSVRVGKNVYVVLYTPPPGTYGVQYRAGSDWPVLVGSKTIKFSNMLGDPMEVPILRRKTASAESSR